MAPGFRALRRDQLALSSFSLFLALLLALALALPANAAREAEAATITVRYTNAPLSKVVEDIAKATGEVFISDPVLPGRFTVIIPRKVTKSEALAVLEAALVMQGYATMVTANGARQILQVKVASSGAPWKGPFLDSQRQNLITTMVTLGEVSAQDVLGKISHLIGESDSAVAYPPTNSVILTGSERRIRRVIELAQALDAGTDVDVWIRTIRHRGAIELSEMLTEAMGSPNPLTPSRDAQLRILADERMNAVIVLGTEDQIARARRFLAEIDVPQGLDTKIKVVRILHREAEEISDILLNLAVGRTLAHTRPDISSDLFGKQYFVVPDGATNSIVVDADEDTFQTIREVIAELDRARPRIQVDVMAYEVTNPSELDLGFDYFVPAIAAEGSNSVLLFNSNPSGGGLRGQAGEDITFFGRAERDPLTLPFADANGNVVDVIVPRETFVMVANAREVQTRVLMQPRLLMTSGEEQRLFAGQNVPIVMGSSADAATNETRTTIERQDVGVELIVTPSLGEAGTVLLDLRLEVSRVAPSLAGNTANVGPTLEKRELETKIRLADGGLAVIGMSQEGSRTRAETGTPFLKDIPILGLLTETSSKDNTDSHLVFSVQARILRSHDQDLAESIRQRLALERSQARVSGLSRTPGEPYAILVATRNDAREADVLADGLTEEGHEVQIGRWKHRSRERFDVYLTGYTSLDPASIDALALRERGFGPQVVVLPGETKLARTPAFRLLGSRLPEVSFRGEDRASDGAEDRAGE